VKIYTNLDEVALIKKPVLTIGTYDGVHLGHQKIINYLNLKAKQVGGESVVFTFHPHPRMVLHPNNHNLELIQTIKERANKLEKAGVDHLIIFPFSIEFSKLTAVEFIRDILVNKIGIHTLVVGYDHQFGRNREGTMQHLEKLAPIYNFELEEISAFMKDEVKISSTKIRTALQIGDIVETTKYLGNPFELTGEVVKGDQIGNTIRFPTANLKIVEDYKLIPCNGVYAVKVSIEGSEFSGMLNIGFRPTITDKGDKRIEVNIFDFNQDIYGQTVTLKFVKLIRSEKTFANLDELKNQLTKDENKCRVVLDNLSYTSN
jgi:riboflavin kinase/FMN adenylyltransferase